MSTFPVFSDHLKFIDIGPNLTDPVFRGIYRGEQKHIDDFDLVLERAKECGVEKMIVTCGNLSETKTALELCKQYDNLYCTVGVHPTRASEIPTDQIDSYFKELEEVANEGIKLKKIVAYGEFGLDYDRLFFSDKLTQQTIFRKQLELAKKLGLPLFLHNRNTGDDFIQILKESFGTEPIVGCVHSFTGTIEEAQSLIAMNLCIGFNGCSMKTEENLEVIRHVDIHHMMIETDCPYCEIRSTHAGYAYVTTKFPQKKSEKYTKGFLVKGRNEPCGIRPVFEVICKLKNLSPQEASTILYENTSKVYFNL